MRIAIYGAGGIGSFYGALLAASGVDVSFIARGKSLEAIRDKGIQVFSPLGDSSTPPLPASALPGEIGPVDAVILCVKSWQVSDAAATLRPLLGPDTVILPLQNGVEAPGQLSAVVSPKHVLGGITRVICFLDAPGIVRHVGIKPFISLGEMGNQKTERVQRLAQVLTAAGIEVEIAEHIGAKMWEKFIFISAISGLGAAARMPFGRLRKIPETRKLYETAVLEGVDLAASQGFPISGALPEELNALFDRLPEEGTTSMQRDIMEGRPSELEAQNGAMVRFGLKWGIPTPVNSFFYSVLLPQEQHARSSYAAA